MQGGAIYIGTCGGSRASYDGAIDKLGNLFDGDDGTGGEQRTVTYELRIDGDGEVEILEEAWE